MMQFMRTPVTMDKTQSTLYSTVSSNTMISGSSGSSRTRTVTSSDSNNNVDDDDENDGSSSDLSYNECDITLIDDEDIHCEGKTDGELLYCQVVEMLRFEVEVCYTLVLFYFSWILFKIIKQRNIT